MSNHVKRLPSYKLYYITNLWICTYPFLSIIYFIFLAINAPYAIEYNLDS